MAIGLARKAATAAPAGAVAGVVAGATFLVLHAAWILPIWFVAPIGLSLAAFVGAAVGAAFERVMPAGARVEGRVAGLLLAPWLVIGPLIVAAEAGLRVGAADAVAVVAGFLVLSIGLGALLVCIRERTWSAARAGGLAGLLLAIGPGHNIPFLAATEAVPTEFTILAVVFAAGSTTFVIATHVLGARSRRQAVGEPTR